MVTSSSIPLIQHCTSDMDLLFADHDAISQLYADDAQAYMRCLSPNAASTVKVVHETLIALETSVASNRLFSSSHPAKTRFMWLVFRLH